MPDKKHNTTNDSLDNLFEAFSELLSTKEQIKAALADDGIDPEKVSRDGLSFIHKLQARTKIEVAKRQMLSKVEAAKIAIRDLIPKLTTSHKEQLTKLLYGEQVSVSVNFNKLSDLNDSDILDMLNEVQILEFLEGIKKKE